MHRADGPCVAVVRHLRHLLRLDLGKRAFVATTPIVVFCPGRAAASMAPWRPAADCAAAVGHRPATCRPASGPRRRPSGGRIDDVADGIDGDERGDDQAARAGGWRSMPMPAFIARPSPAVLPTVAPAPAPTLPSTHRTVAGGIGGLVAALGVRPDLRIAAEGEVEQAGGGHDRHPRDARVESDVALLEPLHRAGGRIEPEGAAAGKHDRMDDLDEVGRVRATPSPWSPARRHGRRRCRRRRSGEDHGAAGRPPGIV